ncbi:conserved hypothetical protein [Candidatus Sulfopaludibacter sp. SbA6]|nr:conserved hypothetical protein [Candidatus Sulfopaludibacter sp. SbA6]
MKVLRKRGLFERAGRHPETIPALERFYDYARKARWHGFNDVRQQFPSVDRVGDVLIFNVLGGNYRLITTVDYPTQRLFIKALMTHREYERKEWLKWA